MNKTTLSQVGFTLLEMLAVISILALIVAIATPVYQNYSDRARASEIIARYDAMRTSVATDLANGIVTSCDELGSTIGNPNLGEDYAELALGFEAVSGGAGATVAGWRPVLTVCARNDQQGSAAVRIAHAALDELSNQHRVESGAVVSDAIISFSLPLTLGNEASCRIAPSTAVAGCGVSSQQTPPQPVALAAPTQRQPVQIAEPPMLRQGIPQCVPPQNVMVDRDVMQFGGGAQGYIVNDGDLDTGGDMTALTVEMAFMGDQQVAASGIHGATIMSYASRGNDNEFSVWNPESVTVSFGSENFDTNLDINDGQSHRLTVTWDSASGQLLVFDNGVQAWSGTGHQGGTIAGNGKLALGGDQDSYGGGFSNEDSFRGRIVGASLATRVVPAANIQRGPVHTAIDSSTGLVTSIVATNQGFEDTTGNYQYTAGSGLTRTRAQVPSSLYVSNDCS